MLRTRFTERFELEHPVMSAPMALHSGGRLAGAVSAAGGLGSFGGIHPAQGPEWITAEVGRIREATDRPFAVGFITAFLPMFGPLFEATLDARPHVVAFSFGDPAPWMTRARAAGAAVMCQVQTLADAQAAVDAGAEVLVAQGTEAGGHTGSRGLLPLLGAVLARHPDIPVLAAGGISDGRSLAAVLAAGADGAWVGTSFLATEEAVEVHDVHKELIVASDGDDTVWTRVYDIASGLPWPAGIGERVRRNAHTERWTGREAELESEPRPEDAPTENPFAKTPDPTIDPILYGQGAHAVHAIRPAGEVVRSISADAEAILRSRVPALLR